MKTFEQWLAEVEEPGVVAGKPRISQGQIAATDDAKQAASHLLQKKPELAAKLAGDGSQAKAAQAKMSAKISGGLAKNANNEIDPVKAAFSGVDDMISDIDNTIEKRMRKK